LLLVISDGAGFGKMNALAAAQGVDACKTAWKNVQGIGENSVENCPPRYVS
jgi:hypothetical protein